MYVRKTIYLALVSLLLFVPDGFAYKSAKLELPKPPSRPRLRYISEIKEAAEAHDIDPALVAAIIHAESNFNTRARSHKGAMGLMQITGPTARKLGLRNAYDPVKNIFAGVKYFSKLMGMFDDDMELALAAYNAGPGAVNKYNGIPPYRETKRYLSKVMAYYKEYSDHPEFELW